MKRAEPIYGMLVLIALLGFVIGYTYIHFDGRYKSHQIEKEADEYRRNWLEIENNVKISDEDWQEFKKVKDNKNDLTKKQRKDSRKEWMEKWKREGNKKN